jgi:hypothetical protein
MSATSKAYLNQLAPSTHGYTQGGTPLGVRGVAHTQAGGRVLNSALVHQVVPLAPQHKISPFPVQYLLHEKDYLVSVVCVCVFVRLCT